MDTQLLLSARSGPEGVRTGLRAARAPVRAALAGMLDDPSLLGPCRLRRTKCKPAAKLTAWYDAGLAGSSVARPVAVSWWDSLPAPEPNAAAEADALERGCAAPFRVLGTDLPALQMRVRVAPLDPGYRGLVPMSDPRHVASVLGYARPPRIDTLRYRPGQRHVLRYEPQVEGEGPTLFAKLYPDDRGVRLQRAAAALAQVLGDGADGEAAQPATYLGTERALVFEQAAGAPLSSMVGRAGGRTARALHQAGAVLRRIHAGDPALLDGPSTRTVADELAEVARASAAITQLAPTTGAVVSEVLDRTSDALDALPQEEPTLVHGDFKTDHLLVGPTSLTLLDVDKCGVADPALDLAKALADLRWWLEGDPAAATAAQERLLDGYGAASPARIARARVLEPLFTVKLTARRVQVHQANWSARTAGPIGRAQRLLRELARA